MANESGFTERGQNTKLTYVRSYFLPSDKVSVTLSGGVFMDVGAGDGSERQQVKF